MRTTLYFQYNENQKKVDHLKSYSDSSIEHVTWGWQKRIRNIQIKMRQYSQQCLEKNRQTYEESKTYISCYFLVGA